MASKKIALLREAMEAAGMDAYLVPLTDEFQGEYVPASSRRLEWLTGFTGSNGLAIILKDKAAFFTDGRYTLQAKQQLSSDYLLFNMAEIAPWDWLASQLKPGEMVGYDPWLHTKKSIQYYKKLSPKPCEPNLIDMLWRDRPAAPSSPAVAHPIAYAGEEGSAKRERLAVYLQEKKLDAIVLTAPDSVCWLLNIRGMDVPHTPFLLCYAIVYADESVDLFVDEQKIPPEVKQHMGDAVRIVPTGELQDYMVTLQGKPIQLDPAQASSWFFNQLPEAMEGEDPCQLWKACKNEVEIAGMRAAHIRDGAALTQFLHWLDTHLGKEPITEISAAGKLGNFRKETGKLVDLSFDTISGFASNGAIVHYRVTETSNKELKGNGLYLVDSGGQYLDGTTDVTRTVAVGTPTEEQRDRYTRVLKGHIALARAVFPEGTTGSQLDALARYHLWQEGLDYDHGTGHGVGSYLSVHEGPQRISKIANNVALKPGMIISNEPGYYKEGEYGIRIENLVLVIEKPELSKNGRRFFGFETLTQAPMDMRLVDKGMLSAEEWQWLEGYHRDVERVLGAYNI